MASLDIGALGLDLLIFPMLAGILVLLTHVPLGRQVLRRGIVFVDLAIAQLAALGVVIAESMHAEGIAATGISVGVALLGALLVGFVAERWPSIREALIGLVYVGSACIALIWVSRDPHAGHRVSSMLAGDVLWVHAEQLVPLLFVTLGWWAIARAWPQIFVQGRGFYAGFAIVISHTVPLIGLYLVFASLIVPALSGSLKAGLLCGLLAYASGLLLSWWLDWPSGPSVVLALLVIGLPLSRFWRGSGAISAVRKEVA